MTGVHAYGTKVAMATVTLSPGPHALRVDYFQNLQKVALSVMVAATPAAAMHTAAVHVAAAMAAAAAAPIDPSTLSHSAVRRAPHWRSSMLLRFVVAAAIAVAVARFIFQSRGMLCPTVHQSVL
jgi:hypothetical protein